MGVPVANCSIVDSQTLRDGMEEIWGEEEIAEITLDAVQKWRIQQVLTFDTYGISGHPNHVATYRGVKHLFGSVCPELNSSLSGVTGWALVSLPWHRKYLGA